MAWQATFGIIIIAAISITTIAFLCIRRLTDQSVLRKDQEVASYLLNTMALFYCLLLGLVVIDVQEACRYP